MGESMVERVVSVLGENGISAVRGYPNEKMPALTGTCAAVTLESWNQKEGTASVLVSVCVPASSGGAFCEEQAQAVALLLQKSGGQCRVAACRQLGDARILCTEVNAQFRGFDMGSGWDTLTVMLGETLLTGVEVFKSWRSIGEAENISLAPWKFRMEERLPPDSKEEIYEEEPFNITVNRGNRAEFYTGCRLTYHRCESANGGLRRIRQGTAGSRSVLG